MKTAALLTGLTLYSVYWRKFCSN